MNILFLTTHLNTGGITQYLLTLTKGFVKRGIEVHVVSSGGNMEGVFTDAGARLLTLDICTKSELSPKIYKVLNFLKKYIQDHAIDIIHSQTRITQVMGTLLNKMTGVKYVSTCHGFFKPRLSRKLMLCWGQRVIAISDVVKQHLNKDFGVEENNIFLVPSGIDLLDFKEATEEEKRDVRLKFKVNNYFVIGMVARLSDVKGQDILVEAMSIIIKKIPQAKLLFIGEGKLEGILRKRVKELGLEDCVQFHSIVNKTSEVLALLDVFINPSRQEGLGLSVMEAQASGLPVVASNVGGIPSLIEDGQTGILVEPENPELLAQAIIKISQDTEQLKMIGLKARQKAEKEYSFEVMVDKTLDVYER